MDMSYDIYEYSQQYEQIKGDDMYIMPLSDRVKMLVTFVCDPKFAKEYQNNLDGLKNLFFNSRWVEKMGVQNVDSYVHIMLVADMQSRKKKFVVAFSKKPCTNENFNIKDVTVFVASKDDLSEIMTIDELKSRLNCKQFKVLKECKAQESESLNAYLNDYFAQTTQKQGEKA